MEMVGSEQIRVEKKSLWNPSAECLLGHAVEVGKGLRQMPDVCPDDLGRARGISLVQGTPVVRGQHELRIVDRDGRIGVAEAIESFSRIYLPLDRWTLVKERVSEVLSGMTEKS